MSKNKTSFLLTILLIVVQLPGNPILAQIDQNPCSAYDPDYIRPTVLPKGDMPPEFPDNVDQIINEIMIYPDVLLKDNVGDSVSILFTVTKDGLIDNIRLLKESHPLLNQEARRIVQSFPRFRPAVSNGELVPYEYNLTINFSPDDYNAYHKTRESNKESRRKSNAFVGGRHGRMPEFPGGQGELLKYLSTSSRYPESLKGTGIKGRIQSSFIVNIFGLTENIQTPEEYDDYPEIKEEITRLLSQMPTWSVGKRTTKCLTEWKSPDPYHYNLRIYYEFVTVKYTVPVIFKE